MAYASLVSLVNILEQNLELYFIPQNNPYIQNLLQEASFFQDFLEKPSQRSGEKIKCLESRIRDVAYKIQDIVDSHVADRLDECVICLASLFEEYHEVDWDESLFQDLVELMEEIHSIKQEVMQIDESNDKEDNNYNIELGLHPSILPPAGVSKPPSGGMTKMVGLDDDFKKIKIRLLSDSLQRETLALVGMGGIGKTTLAKKVFDDKYIISHFDLCRWVTVSQEYSMQNIIAKLLANDIMSKGNNEDLRLDFYKSLKNRRYLIVLDDMWDVKVWDDLKRVLPNDENGSRILLTTRLEHVAKHENSCPPHHVRLLNSEESWGLFCENVFGKDCCPPELEEVGEEIVENCRGLPLAIKVIGGHLSKATRTEHYWRTVAKNLKQTIVSDDEEQVSRVLSLSYKHLPHHLKGCFLYMSIFPEDYKIDVSVLIHLWISSGIIKQDKSLEEVYEEYFLNLVERNLILVWRPQYNGKFKRCRLHDLIRDVCIKEAQNEEFFHLTCKTLYRGHHGEDDVDGALHSRLLRALYPDEWETNFFRIRLRNMAEVHYSLLEKPINLDLTASIHKILHLHTIHLRCSHLTLNIWEMPQLRRVKTGTSLTLPDPPTQIDGKNSIIVLEKLHTLRTVNNFIFTDDVLLRLPNLKRLSVYCVQKTARAANGYHIEVIDWRYFSLNNIGCLEKLESLRCTFLGLTPVVLMRDITFPHSIKKLKLEGSQIPWKDMKVVGLLPNLQVLKLKYDAFVGEEWEPNEGEFLNLRTLHLEKIDGLVHWRAEADHFPMLQHLFIHSCRRLLQIPCSFGEIPTLELINVNSCGESVASSARQIKEEPHEFGNEGFRFTTYRYL